MYGEKMKIYLAGTFSRPWRDRVIKALNGHHICLIPGQTQHESALARFVCHDERLLQESDCMLAYFVNSAISIGTSMEQWGHFIVGKRVILVVENVDTIHPLSLGSAFRVFFKLDVAIDYFKQLKDINDLPSEAKLYYEFLR